VGSDRESGDAGTDLFCERRRVRGHVTQKGMELDEVGGDVALELLSRTRATVTAPTVRTKLLERRRERNHCLEVLHM
jgi:hypothetical protein